MPRIAASLVIVTCVVWVLPGAACVPGTKCVSVPETRKVPLPYEIGETLPRGEYRVLLNTRYHGLPSSDGSFWYYRVGRHVLKVDAKSHEVLEDVTAKARRLTQ